MAPRIARAVLAAAGLSLALAGTASATTTFVPVVKNGDGGWHDLVRFTDFGKVEHVVGPASPPLGSGSVRLTTGTAPNTGGDGAAELRNTAYAGVKVSEIAELGYDTYGVKWNVGQLPYVMLNVDLDNDGVSDNLLFFEPEYQLGYTGAVTPQADAGLGQWQHWTAKTAANSATGGWYALDLSDFSYSYGGPGADVRPLAGYAAAHPNAKIVNDDGVGGVRILSGFASPADEFDANVDAVRLAVTGPSASDSTYDFEKPADVTSETLGAPGTVTSDGDANGATPGDSDMSVTSPTPNTVIIDEDPTPAPTVWEFFGHEYQINVATAGTPAAPLVFTFKLDAADLGAVPLASLNVFKNGGSPIPDCAVPSQASPDPCVKSRAMVGDDAVVTVNTTTASPWVLGADTVPPVITVQRPYPGARYNTFANAKPELTASFSCVDAASGLVPGPAGCQGTVDDGTPFDRSTALAPPSLAFVPKVFTVTSQDVAGNVATTTVNYRIYTFAGLMMADSPRSYLRLGDGAGAGTMAALAGPQGEYKNGHLNEPTGVSGDGDKARRFTGFGGYGFVNGISAPAAYTLSTFVRLDSLAQSGMLMQHGGAGALWWSATDQKFHFRGVDWQPLSEIAAAPGGMAAGQWYHVAATWNGQQGRLFVNGVQVAVGSPAGGASAPSGVATLYVGYGDKAQWLRGALDEPAYYPHVLSTTHIHEIWLADPPAKTKARAKKPKPRAKAKAKAAPVPRA